MRGVVPEPQDVHGPLHVQAGPQVADAAGVLEDHAAPACRFCCRVIHSSAASGATSALRLPAERITDEDPTDVDALVVAPWQGGPQAARCDLYGALTEVCSGAVEFLEGGWDDVQRDGAMAESKVAH